VLSEICPRSLARHKIHVILEPTARPSRSAEDFRSYFFMNGAQRDGFYLRQFLFFLGRPPLLPNVFVPARAHSPTRPLNPDNPTWVPKPLGNPYPKGPPVLSAWSRKTSPLHPTPPKRAMQRAKTITDSSKTPDSIPDCIVLLPAIFFAARSLDIDAFAGSFPHASCRSSYNIFFFVSDNADNLPSENLFVSPPHPLCLFLTASPKLEPPLESSMNPKTSARIPGVTSIPYLFQRSPYEVRKPSFLLVPRLLIC